MRVVDPIFQVLAASRAIVMLVSLTVALAASIAAGHADEALRASAYQMSADGDRTRVELRFDRDPAINWFLLRDPYRLVIDLPKTRFLFEAAALRPTGIVRNVRYGEMGEGRSRIILTASAPFSVEDVDIKPADKHVAAAINLKAASDAAFDTALADQTQTTGAVKAAAATAGQSERKPVIVVDPGHGGIDSGAKSPAGTMEKEITFAFAQELKKKLDETGRYDVLLTRESDSFLPLNARVAFARKHNANLFISIHADTIRVKGLRGATVYTVSDEASDAEAAELADRENLADAVAGIKTDEENQEVADILAELTRRETHGFSIGFARTLIDELSQSVRLIKNPHRHARFRVLRAPDVPSVLVELGYLSNTEDEEQLRNAEWRSKTADSIVEAVNAFALSATRAGG